jgi:hypothetical protein
VGQPVEAGADGVVGAGDARDGPVARSVQEGDRLLAYPREDGSSTDSSALWFDGPEVALIGYFLILYYPRGDAYGHAQPQLSFIEVESFRRVRTRISGFLPNGAKRSNSEVLTTPPATPLQAPDDCESCDGI